MTTDRALALAMQVEDEAHEIYELLARGPSGPQQRELFLRLAAEETQHRLRVDMLRRYCRTNKDAPDLALDTSTIEELLHDTEALRRLFEKSPSLSREETFRLLLALEQRFATVHAETAARTLDAPIRGLFLQLTQQDHAHRELLEQSFGRAGRQ